jgi:hypothetical protein
VLGAFGRQSELSKEAEILALNVDVWRHTVHESKPEYIGGRKQSEARPRRSLKSLAASALRCRSRNLGGVRFQSGSEIFSIFLDDPPHRELTRRLPCGGPSAQQFRNPHRFEGSLALFKETFFC